MNSRDENVRILMVGPFPKPITGQTIANKTLYNGLKRKGHTVDFIDTDTEKKIESLNNQGKFNIKKIINSFKPVINGIIKILFFKYDVIYITPGQSYMGFMKYSQFINAAKLKGIPCYIHIHGGYIRKMFDDCNKKHQKVLSKLFNRCTGIIVLGDSLKCMFNDIVPESKIRVCHNGISDDYILSDKEIIKKINRANKNTRIDILYLSNLLQSKGIIETLEACLKLKDDDIEFHLDVAGNIEDSIKDSIYNYFNKLGKAVTFHGVVTGNEKRKLLEKNSIFCLPIVYRYEGQPISILEAMGMGNAIVTTNNGGIRDIFMNGVNGTLCEGKDISSIVNAILNSHNKRTLFINNNYENISRYSEINFVNCIEKIILSKR